ncbi:hypothetical protein, partial [Mesorhizobium sp.]|uniref:hypothetical protein n=1 Tax=Mesorhizobium sp. TaxID=1871066 RepID=UPI00257EBA25
RCEWIHGFIADFFNTIHPLQTFKLGCRRSSSQHPARDPDISMADRIDLTAMRTQSAALCDISPLEKPRLHAKRLKTANGLN